MQANRLSSVAAVFCSSAAPLVVGLGACAFAHRAPAAGPADGGKQEHFSVSLPKDFHVAKTSPVEDFDIYSISRGDTPYVMVYVGNHPTFPRQPPSGENEHAMLEAQHLRMFSEWSHDTLVRREILVGLPEGNGWPQYIHAWTAPGSAEAVRLADRILVSLKADDSSKGGTSRKGASTESGKGDAAR
jgi:hypothetical protein